MGTVVWQANQRACPALRRVRLRFHQLLGVVPQPEEEVLGTDLLVTRDRLLGGDAKAPCADGRQGVARPQVNDGLAGSEPHSLCRPPVRVVAERLVHAPGDSVQIDPEGGEQLAVAGLRAWQHTLGDQAVDLGPDGREIEAVGAKHAGRRVVAVEEQAEEHVLGPQVAMVQPPSLLMGHAGRDTSRLGDIHRSGDFHHRGYLRDPGRLPGPCFWWTACLLTPSRLAMSCQDQPLVRALSTCRASRTSSSPRREATARRPISGSWLLLATAKVATSRSARFSMPSRYLDDSKAVNPFLTMELSGSQPGDLLPRLALPSGSRADPTGGRPGQWSSCRCCRPAPGVRSW